MKRTVLLAVIITTLNQASPLLAQNAGGLSRASICETNGGNPLQPALDVSRGVKPSDGVMIRRSAQTTPVPNLPRNISFSRLALGAVIGGVAGAALGYGTASRSCGTTASRDECAGYGRLGATVGGGVGAVIGVRIAVGTP